KERVQLRARQTLLNRYRSVLPIINLLRTARQELGLVADAPRLSDNFDARLAQARERTATAQSELAELQQQQQKLLEAQNAEMPPAALLAEEDEIDEIKEQVGADATSRKEEVKEDTFRVDKQGKARDIYRELTGSTDWDQMDGLKPR